MVIGLRDIVTSVFEAASLLEQQRQNAITRQLATWAAMLTKPTGITGMYCMKLENAPDLKIEYCYYVVLAVILVLSGIVYYRRKQARWVCG